MNNIRLLLLLILIFDASKSRQEILRVVSEKCTENEAGQCGGNSAESNGNGDEERGDGFANPDCPQDEFKNEQNLLNLKSMLSNGNKEINRRYDDVENAILILGNAGAGKTTFAQFMAGDNSKLMSKEVPINSGNFVIEDGIKIGMSVTDSYTLYPDPIEFTANESLTDTPGFKDTRTENHEVIETYLMKKYLKNVKRIKIVLVVTYYSLEHGTYKDDFLNLLNSINNFIRDIDNYKKSISLIATKVPNAYRTVKNKVTLVPDEQIISNLAEYLISVQQSLQDKLKESNKVKDLKFVQNAIGIITSLLEKDENLNYRKLNIFRRPMESGILSEMTLLQKEKESIRKTINNIEYNEILENNIGYTLSHEAKIYLNCLLWYINEKVSKMSEHTFQLIENYYKSKIKNYTDVYSLASELEDALIKLKLLKSNLKTSLSYDNYSSLIDKFIINENIGLQVNQKTFLNSELGAHVRNLQQFTNSSKILSTITWSEQMKHVINYIKENLSWYKFLIKTFEYSSTYTLQNMKSKYFNTSNIKEVQNNLEKLILTNDDWSDKNSDTNFNVLTLDDNRKTEINNIFSFTLKERITVTCDVNGKLIIKGYYIKFSDINSEDFLKKHCRNTIITVIGIFTIHTVFIDADFNSENFRGVDIMIVAPRWEIIGNRIINIDGIPGYSHRNYSAKNGDTVGEGGRDGLPGLPGGNGGNFIGIGLYFINDDKLTISANGGKGGPGQNGGNGREGKNGKNGYEKFYDNLPNDDNYDTLWSTGMKDFPFSNEDWKTSVITNHSTETWFCYDEIYVYSQEGDCGSAGGAGGNGGVGGIGGLNGSVILIGEKKNPKFIVKNSPGTSGNAGKGGIGGKLGEKGSANTCLKLKQLSRKYDQTGIWWICTNLTDIIHSCDTTTVDGVANYSAIGIQKPSELHTNDFSSDLFSYTVLLNNNENNKYLVPTVKKLQTHIYKTLSSMKNILWKFIFAQETTPIDEPDTTVENVEVTTQTAKQMKTTSINEPDNINNGYDFQTVGL